MKLLSLLALTAILGVSACGAGQETGPAGSTESSQAGLEAPLPDVALVACQADRAPMIETPAVKPQRDGVHFKLVNDTDMELAFSIEDPSGVGMGVNAPQGTSTQVADIHPGSVSIACYDGLTEDGSEVAATSLEIVDEDDVWIPTSLDCVTAFSGTSDYIEGARGTADPRVAAREALAGYLQEDDVVEAAGYPDAGTRIYRLTRGGEILATVSLLDDGAGGWLADIVNGCSSLEG